MTRTLNTPKVLIIVVALTLCSLTQAATWIPFNGIRTGSTAPEVQLLQSDYSAIRLQFHMDGCLQETVSTPVGEFTALSIAGEGFTTDVGAPALPVIRRLVEIPYGSEISLKLHQISKLDATLDGFKLHRIKPLQQLVAKTTVAEAEAAFTLDQAAYQRTGFILSDLVRVGDPQIMRGHRFILLEIFPINYSSVDGRLEFLHEVEIELTLTGSDAAMSRHQQERYSNFQTDALVKKLFINADASDETDLIALPIGMLIVTTPAIAPSPILQDFVEWKVKKGYHTTVATTAQTGTTAAQIKAYIQNAYDHWDVPPQFVVLIGDTDVIPEWPGQAPDIPGTDLYYATLEGNDYFSDVGLGRISVESDTDLVNILSKIINYEQALWNGDNWEKAAVFLASNDMWQLTESTHDSVITNYLQPDGYRSTRLYCHTFSATPDQVSNAINAGRSLAIYAGHGYCVFWQDGPRFLPRDVEDLTNDYYPFVASFACDTGQFMRGHECFGETWIRVPHGAIAFWGATCTSYWGADDILERALFQGFFDEQLQQQDQNLTWIAGMTDYAKYMLWRQFGGATIAFYYWELYNILGDPSVDVWTDTPQNLTVTIPPTVQIGQTSLQINVSGFPDWAMVNIYSDAEDVQYTGYVNNGSVIFNLGAGFSTTGTLHVWITGHDCRPSHGTSNIISQRTASAAKSPTSEINSLIPTDLCMSATPNPFNPTTTIRFGLPAASQVTLEVFDINGRAVGAHCMRPSGGGGGSAGACNAPLQAWYPAGYHEIPFDGSRLPSGVYIYRLTMSGSGATPTMARGKMVLLK